jgi:alpha-beta hydrolase superfamily lysophospholipase
MACISTAMEELGLPATFFQVPYEGKALPGLFLRNASPEAPVVLVIGGADTSLEDLFLSVGRGIGERGYSVAIVDLPGQGITPADGLHWETEPERPIAAVIDTLVQRFGALPGRIALIGLSLGGYFVTRAAGFETRLSTVIASTPFPEPGQLFGLSVRAAMAAGPTAPAPSAAARRSRQVAFWKAGVTTPAAIHRCSRHKRASGTTASAPPARSSSSWTRPAAPTVTARSTRACAWCRKPAAGWTRSSDRQPVEASGCRHRTAVAGRQLGVARHVLRVVGVAAHRP